MHVVTEYPNGIFCWIDLATNDTAGAKTFYQGLFGWEANDVPTDMGTVYSRMEIAGKSVAGLGPMDPNMEAQGVPPIWTSYVKHDDVNAVASRAQEAGGTVMFPPMDVMNEGRMTMIQDPMGAVFGVWQPKNHIGAQLVNMPNTLVWNELQTNDVERAKSFYGSVFGWTNQTDENGYVVFMAGDRAQAGMMAIDPSWGNVPPNWSVYIMVEDLDAAAAKAQELGGSLLVPPTEAGEIGRFSVVRDPQGGALTIMQFSGPVSPPPGAEG